MTAIRPPAAAPAGESPGEEARDPGARRPRPALPAGERWLRRTRLVKPALWALLLVPLAGLAWSAYAGTLGANPIEKVEDVTGRWALRILLLSLAVTPLRRLTGWNALIRYRRLIGLFAFFYAVMHLSAYVGLDMFFDVGDIVEDVTDRLWITIGMATFLTLVPVAVTSTSGWIRRLGGARWNRLHRLTYVAAVLGVIHYSLAVKKDVTQPLLLAAVLAVLLGARWRWRGRAGRPSVA
ncbi:MAG TPA: protein-methionine-sulfoxide reductase heme-binding subunit MsrQ [Gemmatimonadaceae bacterium]|nr:protein-methionine-sulfoxide reductase heme-binding subunit MsrQ [Gemmatimonadaceae bacterium]